MTVNPLTLVAVLVGAVLLGVAVIKLTEPSTPPAPNPANNGLRIHYSPVPSAHEFVC